MFLWIKKNLKYLLPIVIAVTFFASPNIASAGWFDWLSPSKQIENAFVQGVMYFLDAILQAFSIFLALAALALELVINITIVKMRLLIEGDGGSYAGIQAINLAWRTIRDIANILFVFVLLLVSINIILGSWSMSGPYKKELIPKIIIAALLINFSLFFTKVVIDVSNLTAYEFYKTAANIRGEGNTELFGIIPTTGLTSSIMNGLKLTNFVNDQGKLVGAERNPSYLLFSTILGIIVVLVAANILLVMAVLLIVRFVMFVFLMITSPIAFVGDLLPQLSKHSKKWWETLTNQAAFAPIFFALMLVVIVFINDKDFGKNITQVIGVGAQNSDEIGAYVAGLVGILVQYLIVIGLLTTALVAAKQTAGKTGAGFVKWGEKFAKGATTGAVFGAGRRILGAGKFVAATAAREGVSRGAEVIGKRYDSFIAAKGPEAYRKWNTQTLGLSGALDRGLRGKIKSAEDAKFGLKQTRTQIQEADKKRARELTGVKKENETYADIDNNKGYVYDALFNPSSSTKFDSENDDRIKKYLEAVKNLTDKQLDKMLEDNLDLLKNETFAGALTAKQLQYIRDSKLIEKETSKDIEKAYEKGAAKRVEMAPDPIIEAKKVATGKPSDVASLPSSVLTNQHVATTLNTGVLKEILNGEKLNTEDRAKIKKAIEDRALTLAGQPSMSPVEKVEFERLDKTMKWIESPDRADW